MKRITLIKHAYGKPQENTVNFAGEVIHGWRLYNADGSPAKLDGLSNEQIAEAYALATEGAAEA